MAQTKPKAGQFYGVSDNGTDGEFLQTDGTGGMAWASPITNPTITSIDYPGTATAANPAGGQSVIINGTLFASGITCTVGGTTVTTVFNSATQITINTPAKSAGAYTVAVTNSNGGTASQANFIQYSGIPIWTTAAGNIGSVTEGAAASFQVTATEGTDTIEYAVTTGTLPTGLSLATATGAITGTAPAVSADTTTTFSITATDDENQTSAVRSFNIIVTNDAPSNHFNTVLYTGTGSNQAISTVGFQPGLTWIKNRDTSSVATIHNTINGAGYYLVPSTNGAISTLQTDVFSSFDSNGFTVGTSDATNKNGTNLVAWNFKAGGAAVDNTDGTITSKVSVNNTLGFSIVEYETSGVQSIGHGLDSTPSMVIQKQYSTSSRWTVYTATAGLGKYLQLDQADALTSDAYFFSAINDSTFTTAWSGTNYKYINYCFTSKPGFSKVGSYTGNGSTNGPMVNTGFEPAFVMVKGSSNSGSWIMYDNKRSTTNPRNKQIRADSNIAETTSSNLSIDFFANGFQLKGSDTDYNGSGRTFIYLSMAADGSTATPTLANSFATEIYTGDGGTQSITTGLKPDFVWLKGRNNGNTHILTDSVRGTNSQISSPSSSAATAGAANVTAFNANGFSIGDAGNTNTSSQTYVSWNWKAGGIPSINTDGSITSLVSANQAAGFSVAKWTANATTLTAGHGLGVIPDLVILKVTTTADSWFVNSSALTNQTDKALRLNETSTEETNSAFWNNTAPTSTTISVGDGISISGQSYIAYCWKSITGYSKVGSYVGGGNVNPVINVGFTPTWLMVKRTNGGSGGWTMVDNKRHPGTPSYVNGNVLYADESLAEQDDDNLRGFVITSTGFTPNGNYSTTNNSGDTYIYLAIKEN